MKQIEAFNIKFHPLTRTEFVSVIRENIEKGTRLVQFGVNSATVVDLGHDDIYRSVLKDIDLVNIDGMSVVWALRLFGYKITERVATPDLAHDILEMAALNGKSVYLFGAREDVISSCVINLHHQYPNLRIAGSRNGYFLPEEEQNIVEQINLVHPDILLLGMSSPHKEFFVNKNKDKLKVKYILGVGGYFDILSGCTSRAPMWMQVTGLEWLFRLMQEPKRMWKRYLIGNFVFLWIVLKELRNLRRNRRLYGNAS